MPEYSVIATVVHGHTFTVSTRYNLRDSKILGRGSFGVVCTAVDTETGRTLAIKRIRPYANDEWDARHTLREIRLLRLLGPHPNVISLYDLSLFDDKSELYMMMELMDCDLHRVISSKQPLSTKHFKCFTRQILEGIRAMHEVGVFHRDLKPGNIVSLSVVVPLVSDASIINLSLLHVTAVGIERLSAAHNRLWPGAVYG